MDLDPLGLLQITSLSTPSGAATAAECGIEVGPGLLAGFLALLGKRPQPRNANGDKSEEEYYKHIEVLRRMYEKLRQLEEALRDPRLNHKQREAIKAEIAKLKKGRKGIKGHEDEIKDKWPNGPPNPD